MNNHTITFPNYIENWVASRVMANDLASIDAYVIMLIDADRRLNGLTASFEAAAAQLSCLDEDDAPVAPLVNLSAGAMLPRGGFGR